MDYDDGPIACSDDALVIRRYGLFLREKRVPYPEALLRILDAIPSLVVRR